MSNNTVTDVEEYIIDLDTIFSITAARFKNDVLISLQNYNQKAYIYICTTSLEIEDNNSWTFEQKNRVRQILHTICKNNVFIKIYFPHVGRIPGTLLAEWIRINETVTNIELSFNTEDGIEELSYAIQTDTTIKILKVYSIIDLSHTAVKTLTDAFHQNKGIRYMSIHQFNEDHMIFFEQGIALNKHIQHLEFNYPPFGWNDTTSKLQKILGNVLTTNTSITSLHCHLLDQQPDNMIAHNGIIASDRIKKIEFTFQKNSSGGTDYSLKESVLVQSIKNMSHLEHLKINFCWFQSFNADLAKALQASNASIQLEIYFDATETTANSLNSMIDEISSWNMQKPKIGIQFTNPPQEGYDYNWKMLQKIPLTKIVVYEPSVENFLSIVEEIPNWKEIEIFRLEFLRAGLAHQIVSHHDKLAAAISDNYSVKEVKIFLDENILVNDNAEKWINQSLRRNRFLSECQALDIPTELIPTFMEFSNNNPDFLLNLMKTHTGQLFGSTIVTERGGLRS